jgi:hypothetical protein
VVGELFAPAGLESAPDLHQEAADAAVTVDPDVESAVDPDGTDDPARTGRFRIPAAARRGTAVVIAAGSALALAGAASNFAFDAGPAHTDAALRLDTAATTDSLAEQRAAAPVLAPAAVLDTAAVTEMVRQAQRQADTQAAQQKAAAEAEAKKTAEEARAKAKAAEEAQAKAKAAATAAAAATSADCGLSTSGLGGVKPWVADAAEFLGCLFGRPTMLGVGGRGGASDHPTGLAVDFMVSSAVGDRLAACALRNKDALGITYVIWKQRINYGSGWKGMEDRGSATANHMDHVHVSFGSSAPGGKPVAC